MRLARLVLPVLLTLATRGATAQAPLDPLRAHVGASLRLETRARHRVLLVPRYRAIDGRLLAVDGDTLLLQRTLALAPGQEQDTLDRVRVSTDALRRAFVRDGHEPRLRAAARDAAWGALLGAVVAGGAYATARLSAHYLPRKYLPIPGDEVDDVAHVHEATLRAARYGAVLVPAGALYGLLRPHVRWREIPLGSR